MVATKTTPARVQASVREDEATGSGNLPAGLQAISHDRRRHPHHHPQHHHHQQYHQHHHHHHKEHLQFSDLIPDSGDLTCTDMADLFDRA
eukprot:2986368-Amphidinium_carterae.1